MIALFHIVMAVRKQTYHSSFFKQPIIASTLTVTLLVGITLSVYDKTQLYTVRNLSELEVAVVNGFAHIYHPVERVAYGLYSNHLIAKQVDGVIKANREIKIDSCAMHRQSCSRGG